MTENAKKVLEKIVQMTSEKAVVLEMEESKTDVFDSKIGGKPYLPMDAEYPCSTRAETAGEPLVLLCQLNLEQFPGYCDMPPKGILQFFIAPDGVYGMSDDRVTQDDFRVVYYEEIIHDRTKLKEPPRISYDPDDVPFHKELKLTYHVTSKPMSDLSDDFNAVYQKALSETGIKLTDDEFCDVTNALTDLATYSGWCKNLVYNQGNPRPEKYPELLLQIDSDCSGKTGIMWGDAGTAHFFIAPEKLKARDFTQVYYQWDCG